MVDLNEIKLKQISESVKQKTPIPAEKIGQKIQNIREALGMTQKQLSLKLKISQPFLSRIEENAENCTVKTLVKIARGLECEFMGVLISDQGLEGIIKAQAEKKAKEILKRTFANMAMEQQTPDNDAYQFQLERLTEELTVNPNSSLWEK